MNTTENVDAKKCALAVEMFDHFCTAGTLKMIVGLHREICHCLNLKPNRFLDFYPKLKTKLAKSWKAAALFKKFDLRANHKVYAKGRACSQNKVLIIGAGPCGLRTAIECQLLGAKVVIVEKRDRLSRNNVVHLWPFVIEDLRSLGAKKFFGQFCAGSIDHISIRQLQCILLKVALLLGVEFHEGISFEELLEPTITSDSEVLGWRARVTPETHPVAEYEFDVLIGADGKRNTLQHFKRNEFRGKLALAITANFINRRTEQEASVPEISGVAFIFNQKFFNDLNERTGINLENIVYYKDDTHYFVMTAKKQSLLNKGVLLNDYPDVSKLLSVENVNRDALMDYAKEAAHFSTNGKLPVLDFALNHYGGPDVALFDFTSMFAAENASMVFERHGCRLLCQLVGDSLLEPFWPTGSGCARGFLSSLDACWAVRSFGQTPSPHPLEVIAERESIYRLLGQTTPENLNRDFGAYTLDPGTRYPNLNRSIVTPQRVTSYYISDDPVPLGENSTTRKRRREPDVSDEVLLAFVGCPESGLRAATSSASLATLLTRYRPDLLPRTASHRLVYKILSNEFGIAPISSKVSSQRSVPEEQLRSYLNNVYNIFKGEIPHVHHKSNLFEQIKQNQLREQSLRHATDQTLSTYSNAAHSSLRKKRRSNEHNVSNDPAEFLQQKIGKLEINDITKLARLIEGHDTMQNDNKHNTKQKKLQEQIFALLDSKDSPDPKVIRESVNHFLHYPTKTKLKSKECTDKSIARFFQDISTEHKPSKPPKKLKGLDVESIKVPDFSDIFDDSADTDTTVVKPVPLANFHEQIETTQIVKKNRFFRSASTDSSLHPIDRRLSEVVVGQRKRSSKSPEIQFHKARSNSIGAVEIEHNTKRIAQIFEDNKRRHTPSPESRFVRSGSISNPEMILRLQRMKEIIEGKRVSSPSPDRTKRSESIGNPEMALRRQKVAELIEGCKPQRNLSPEPIPLKRNSEEISFRAQRVSDMMQKRNEKRPKTGKRKAAREIMKQRFEKSLQMLATEPRLDFASTDLENDYGLQQYRASAVQFGERVKRLEKKLQHKEEGRVVGSGSRTPGKGDRIAQLATELCDTSTVSNHPRPSKPKDLMRAVGRIEPGDWNVKEIEKRILENRLGRPEPKVAERVPKWDRVEFLERQKRLQESGSNFEKAKDVDETLNKLNERRDSRPALGTNRVANLANEFAKKYQSDSEKNERSELYTPKKTWRGPSSTGMTCASCSRRVFAAEAVKADGLHLHRSCFRCAVCKATLRPGNYTMERNGMRLVCLRHGGMSVPDTVVVTTTTAKSPQNVPMPMPERISLGLSDAGAKEIDEDEWTDRNFLMSETSAAGGRSDEDDSSSDDYADAAEEENPDNDDYGPICGVTLTRPKYNKDSDDSFGYDDCSDDAVESSGSCSRMRAAREARRMEVPADQRPPIDSSEVESDDESESSEDEVSSATEVSTDSEFGREETAIQPSLPAILVTEPTTPRPQPQDCPLSRTRSAGGLATKRALELKRRYLLGESSPLAVRKSDSTSQLDTKIEAFRTNITEFQKMLHPAPVPAALNVAFQLSNVEKAKPMPDIIKKICDEAPVDLLDSPLSRNGKRAETSEEIESDKPLDSDSLSDDSHTQTVPNQSVPRLEVHNEGGELIDYNITLVTDDTDDKGSGTLTGATVLAAESESSESCRDGTTLALTETELSDWAAESGVLDECSLEYKEDRRRCKNPRTLSNPKLIHDAKNVTALSSHVCGRTSPEKFSNALEHFEFADEGDQDPSVEKAGNLSNEGFMEVVHDFDHDSSRILKNDNELSKKLIDSFSEMIIRPNLNVRYAIRRPEYSNSIDHNCTENTVQQTFNSVDQSTDSVSNHSNNNSPIKYENQTNSITERELNGTDHTESLNSDISPPLVHSKIEDLIETSKDIEIHNSNNCEKTVSPSRINVTNEFSSKTYPFRVLSPTLGQTSETFHRLNSSYSTGSPNIEQLASDETASTGKFNTLDNVMSPSTVVISSKTSSTDIPVSPSNLRTLSPGAYSLVSSVIDNYSESSPSPQQNKVLEINRERQKQTEVVRGLVLERLGNGPRLNRRSSKRPRMTVVSSVPPPVPPPPTFQITPPQTPPLQDSFSPPRPAPPVMPLPVTPSLSDPELTRERRNKSILNSITKCLNRRFGPRDKINPPLQRMLSPTKSTGALEELAPPVPPPPVQYQPMPEVSPVIPITGYKRDPARDALIVLNLANEYAEQKVKLREETDATASRLSMLEKSLRRNMTAEQQAKAVAELLQVSAQRDAHAALQAADKKRKNPDNPDH